MKSFTAGFLAALTLLTYTVMADASPQLPLIEPGPGPRAAPTGYRWYIVRNWEHVYTGKASGVVRGLDAGPMFHPDELLFTTKFGDTLRQRSPRVPGEVSHILLPASFELPANVAALKAPPTPSALPAKEALDFSQLKFVKEIAPAGTPEGYTAYTFVVPKLVFSGTVEKFEGAGSKFFFSGHDVHVRQAERSGEPSHILVPNGTVIPAAFRRAQ